MSKRREQNRKAFEAERRRRSTDLRQLARALEEKAVCNVAPIIQAANDCLGNHNRAANCWGYNLDDLLFILDTPRNTRPASMGKQMNARLSMEVSCRCSDKTHNPFERLQINLEFYDTEPPK